MGALAYVAAGTTAFLTYKTAQCASQCGFGGGGGCCSMAAMYGAMAAAAGIQTVDNV